jgi:hypothetical protein
MRNIHWVNQVMMAGILIAGLTAVNPVDAWSGPTPTPTCPPTGATCDLNQQTFTAGDSFILNGILCNGFDGELLFNLVVVLDVYGQYWFFPTWTRNLDYMAVTIPGCSCISEMLLNFPWPEEEVIFDDVCIYMALFDEWMSHMYGQISICCFKGR